MSDFLPNDYEVPVLITAGTYLVSVSESDLARVGQFKWFQDHGYARTKINGRNFYLHRLLMNPSRGESVDHINGNGLDNTRENLRLVTHQQNHFNEKLPKNNKSGYKGVCWNTKRGKWMAYIKINYKFKHLGQFENKIDAAKAYNAAAQKYFGKYAKVNDLKGGVI